MAVTTKTTSIAPLRTADQIVPEEAPTTSALAWFRRMADCLGDRLTIRVATKDSRALASIITIRFKDFLVYKYACSDPCFLRLGGNIFLLWETTQEAKRNGLLELDFGRCEEHHDGLATFKERWGATRFAPPIRAVHNGKR